MPDMAIEELSSAPAVNAECPLPPGRPAPPDDPQPTPADDFAQRVIRASDLLQANPLNRPSLYQILKACQAKRRLLHELEQHIQGLTEFQRATQPPYQLIQWLVGCDALDVIELDEEGARISPEQKEAWRAEGLSQDDIEDRIQDLAYQTNEVGSAVIEEFSPKHRLVKLLNDRPERYDSYIELLQFLEQKRSYLEVDQLFRGREVLMSGRPEGERPMQPSVLLDKLSAAGSISFNDGWMITEEGKELLEGLL